MPRLSSSKLLAAATLAAGFGTPASAHIGDHSHMSFGDLADHLMSKPDHALTTAAVAVVLSIVAFSVALKRRKARARATRFPETPAT